MRWARNRSMAYRPPRESAHGRTTLRDLYVRFVRPYVLPYRWRLALCICLVAMNGCSVYVMAWYARAAGVLPVTFDSFQAPDLGPSPASTMLVSGPPTEVVVVVSVQPVAMTNKAVQSTAKSVA